ncbi:MAG: hypothetical protein EXR79_06940 [Myxococcales bacterium]|nr:hypothetical protein [Myxococcales bacterium]
MPLPFALRRCQSPVSGWGALAVALAGCGLDTVGPDLDAWQSAHSGDVPADSAGANTAADSALALDTDAAAPTADANADTVADTAAPPDSTAGDALDSQSAAADGDAPATDADGANADGANADGADADANPGPVDIDAALPGCTTPTDCDDGDPCTQDGCTAGSCSTLPSAGTPCDDGDACSVGDSCKGGVCAAGPATSCDDGNACTADGCVAGKGCVHVAAPGPCDDGKLCTAGDVCTGEACVGVGVGLETTLGVVGEFDSVTAILDSDSAIVGGTRTAVAADAPTLSRVVRIAGGTAVWTWTAKASATTELTDMVGAAGGSILMVGSRTAKGSAKQAWVARVTDDGKDAGVDFAFGGSGDFDLRGVAARPGGFLAVGSVQPPSGAPAALIALLDPSGVLLKSLQLAGGTAARLHDIASTTDGLVAIGSQTVAGEVLAWFVRLDAKGAVIAQHLVGEAGVDVLLERMAPMPSGGVVAVGRLEFGQPIAVRWKPTGGKPTLLKIPSAAFDSPLAVTATADGGFVAVGWRKPKTGPNVPFIHRLDAGGALVWSRVGTAAGAWTAVARVPTGLLVTGWSGNPFAVNPEEVDGIVQALDGWGYPSCAASGLCAALAACDDGKACTVDACGATTGCFAVNGLGPCDDGDACTIGDSCAGGACGGGALGCDDANTCTADACALATGCTHTKLDQAVCTDGNPCTLGDTCQGAMCAAGAALNLCDDADPCSTDACALPSGCIHTDSATGTSCGDGVTCAAGVCKDVWTQSIATGTGLPGDACAVRPSGEVWCWKTPALDAGKVMFGKPSPAKSLGKAGKVVLGHMFLCTLDKSNANAVTCTGNNEYQQIWGTKDDASFTTLDAPSLAVTSGEKHSCGVLASTGLAKCWGFAYLGQIGYGQTFPGGVDATDVLVGPGKPLVGVTDLDAGGSNQTCAVHSGGQVSCWGVGGVGLGYGSTLLYAKAAPLPEAATAVGVGPNGACAVLASGNVMCWGKDQFNLVGFGQSGPTAAPMAVPGITNAVEVALGTEHACARTKSGGVACWGSSQQGQCGPDGCGASKLVKGLTDIVQVTARGTATCVLREDGAVACFGRFAEATTVFATPQWLLESQP